MAQDLEQLLAAQNTRISVHEFETNHYNTSIKLYNKDFDIVWMEVTEPNIALLIPLLNQQQKLALQADLGKAKNLSFDHEAINSIFNPKKTPQQTHESITEPAAPSESPTTSPKKIDHEQIGQLLDPENKALLVKTIQQPIDLKNLLSLINDNDTDDRIKIITSLGRKKIRSLIASDHTGLLSPYKSAFIESYKKIREQDQRNYFSPLFSLFQYSKAQKISAAEKLLDDNNNSSSGASRQGLLGMIAAM